MPTSRALLERLMNVRVAPLGKHPDKPLVPRFVQSGETPSNYLGTLRHYRNEHSTASIHVHYASTWYSRRYMLGLEAPHYPVPAVVYVERVDWKQTTKTHDLCWSTFIYVPTLQVWHVPN